MEMLPKPEETHSCQEGFLRGSSKLRFVALKQMNTKGLAQLTGIRFIPVSCANMLIIGGLSATAIIKIARSIRNGLKG